MNPINVYATKGETMKYIRFDPLHELEHDEHNADNQVSKAWGYDNVVDEDLRVDGQELNARVSLPLFSPDEVTVTAYPDSIDIKANHDEKKEDHRAGDHSFSSTNRTYWRRMPIPSNADIDKLKTAFRNGVLTIHLPLQQPHTHRK